MKKLKSMVSWVWYPWLAVLYPLIFLYSLNFDKVFGDEFLIACLLALAVVGILVGLFWLITRSLHKAAIMSLALIIPFFTYGQILSQLSASDSGSGDAFPLLPVLLGAGVLAIVAIAIWL